MDNVARLRAARHQAVKVQRRIWLVQLAFWPAVVLTSVILALLGVRWLQRRRRASVAPTAPPRSPADNGQVS